MAPTTSSGAEDVFASSASAPNRFSDKFMDYQMAKFLGYASTGGAETAECYATASRIQDGDWDSWILEWSRTAERVQELGENALRHGHVISARDAFLRATGYWQAAFFLCFDKDPRKATLWDHHSGCFQRAGKLFDPPFERILIPYEGKYLTGYFMKCDERPRPTVLFQMGADGSAEQLYFSGGAAAALRRGYNALTFDGPGQTGSFMRDRNVTYRYDWEVAVSAVVDYALTRKEVDPSKIVLTAYSLGGYFGPRAIAFEKRIAACCVSGLVPDAMDLTGTRLQAAKQDPSTWNQEIKWLLFEHFPKYGGSGGLADIPLVEAMWSKMNLYGLEDKISTTPLFVCQAAGEGTKISSNAKAFFDKLTNKKNKFVFTTEEDGAEMHCQKGNSSLLHALQFDWLDDVLKEGH